MRYKLSPIESYLVGVLLGDGYINRYQDHSDRIGLHTTNEQFAKEFYSGLLKLATERQYLQHHRLYGAGPSLRRYGREFYVEWYGSRVCNLAEWLIARFEQNYIQLGKKRLFAFLKGFYDSEGTYEIKPKGVHRITLYNTNTHYINLVKRVLQNLDFKINLNSTQRSGWARLYMLRITGKKSLQRFFQWIQPVPNKKPASVVLPHRNALGPKYRLARDIET